MTGGAPFDHVLIRLYPVTLTLTLTLPVPLSFSTIFPIIIFPLSNVVLISACAGSFAKRFVEYGVSVRVGPWRTLIQNIRDPYAFICNTIMTADCVEELTRTTQVPVIWLVHEWWDCDEMIDKQLKMRNNSLNLATIKQAFTVATRVVFVCNAQKALYSPTAPSRYTHTHTHTHTYAA